MPSEVTGPGLRRRPVSSQGAAGICVIGRGQRDGQRHPHPGLVLEGGHILVEHECLIHPVILLIALVEDGLLHDAHVLVVPLRVVPHPGRQG